MSEATFVDYLKENIFSTQNLKALYPLIRTRLNTFDEFINRHGFFFNGALDYDRLEICPKKQDPADFKKMLVQLVEKLDEIYNWKAKTLQNTLDEHRKQLDWKPRDYYMPVRLITTGRKDSPPLDQTLEVLGRDMVRFRIRNYITILSSSL